MSSLELNPYARGGVGRGWALDGAEVPVSEPEAAVASGQASFEVRFVDATMPAAARADAVVRLALFEDDDCVTVVVVSMRGGDVARLARRMKPSHADPRQRVVEAMAVFGAERLEVEPARSTGALLRLRPGADDVAAIAESATVLPPLAYGAIVHRFGGPSRSGGGRELPVANRSRARRAILWAVASIGSVVLASTLVLPSQYRELQSAVDAPFASLVADAGAGDVRAAAALDCGLAVLYAAAGCLALLCLFAVRRRRVWPAHAGEWTALVAIAVAGLADIGENIVLFVAAGRVGDGHDPGALDEVMRVFGTSKWSGVGVAVALAAWLALRPARAPVRSLPDPRARPAWHGGEAPAGVETEPVDTDGEEAGRWHRALFGVPGTEPDPGAEATGTSIAPWDPPPAPTERVGVCCSGGGIRSAAFSLGVLQVLDEKGVLDRATYLAAVSGGGYTAAGYEVAHRGGPPPPGEPPLYGEGSPEERHFRNHSSYLIPSFVRALPGVGALLFGLLVNAVIIWLALSVVARPVGWTISAVHHELRARQPAAFVERATADIELQSPVEVSPATPPGRDEDVRWFEVGVAPAGGDGRPACLELLSSSERDTRIAFTVDQVRPAVVQVREGEATVVRQPAVVPAAKPVEAGDCNGAAGDRVTRLAERLAVDRQPTITVDPDVVVPAVVGELRRQLEVTQQPHLRADVGLRGRDDITVEAYLWWLAAGPLGLGLLLTAVRLLLRLQGPARRAVAVVQRSAVIVGGILTAVVIVLPWMTQELPQWLATVSAWATGGDDEPSPLGSGTPSYLAPGTGLVVLGIAALQRMLSSNQSTAAPAGGAAPAVPWWKKPWRALAGAREPLGWYELSAGKLLAGVVLVVLPLLLFLQVLVYATANGAGGRLLGLDLYQRHLGYELWPTEWAKFAAAVVVLIAFARLVDAHAWSIHPFYKRRLSDAYLVRRRGWRAEPVPYDTTPLPFHKPAGGFPQLILGCAVNLSEIGVTPPGRRAASFTFSSTEIGGPLVGYADPRTYWDRIGMARRRDVTVPSAMAISGAAFSPAMGKFNLGAVGAIYAALNLRLGVWLPKPEAVNVQAYRWIDRPGWTWYIREILNLYRRRARYVYVSDGGHWENLGLVELLRRGCTEIVCINAGGDRQDNFGTIGEAVALAREELGVEITFLDPQPTDLRPPVEASAQGRLLRRTGSKDKATPLAVASFAYGTFTYPESGRQGRLWLLEPALTAGMPFDVHVYAEGVVIFPDDSTADQVFNHRQFESFRALGEHQARAMFE